MTRKAIIRLTPYTKPEHRNNLLSGSGAVWQRAAFGTQRYRVQIPAPRPPSFQVTVRRLASGLAAGPVANSVATGPELTMMSEYSNPRYQVNPIGVSRA